MHRKVFKCEVGATEMFLKVCVWLTKHQNPEKLQMRGKFQHATRPKSSMRRGQNYPSSPLLILNWFPKHSVDLVRLKKKSVSSFIFYLIFIVDRKLMSGYQIEFRYATFKFTAKFGIHHKPNQLLYLQE